MVVHIPVLGSPLLLAFGWKAIHSKLATDYKVYYWSSLFIAIASSIAYFTGPLTADWVKEQYTNYSKDFVENHALWGRIGFVTSVLGGVLSIMALANYAQDEKPHKSIPWILLIILLLTVLLFTYTAHLGGLIRRPDLL
jgi:uncharacterized membrane protein